MEFKTLLPYWSTGESLDLMLMLNADTFYDHDADIDCANFEKIWTEVREVFRQL